jgi:ATP-dependent Clp protease ATP-binding subunit ClpB
LAGGSFTLETIQSALDKAIRSKLTRQDPPPSEIRPNGRFFQVLKKAQQLQKAQKDSHTAVDHILLALFDDSDVNAALAAAGLTRRKLEEAIKQVRGTRKITK